MKSDYTFKNIITLPHSHLRQRSKKVTTIDNHVRQIINDMIAATLDWEDSRDNEVAVALAAIQIDIPVRIVIIRENFNDKNNRNFVVLINPEIVKYEGDIVVDEEGCLSVANVYGKVPRYSKVRCRAIDADGNLVKFKSTDPFTARILQHEIDHTNGICFVDHIAKDQQAFSILTKDGDLKPCSFKEVEKMNILPDETNNNIIK